MLIVLRKPVEIYIWGRPSWIFLWNIKQNAHCFRLKTILTDSNWNPWPWKYEFVTNSLSLSWLVIEIHDFEFLREWWSNFKNWLKWEVEWLISDASMVNIVLKTPLDIEIPLTEITVTLPVKKYKLFSGYAYKFAIRTDAILDFTMKICFYAAENSFIGFLDLENLFLDTKIVLIR